MKKIAYFLGFLLLIFLLNILLYYKQEDYRFFLKKLKYWNEIVYIDETNFTDDYFIDIDKSLVNNLKETNSWSIQNNDCNCDCSLNNENLKNIIENIEETSSWILDLSQVQNDDNVNDDNVLEEKEIVKSNTWLTLEDKEFLWYFSNYNFFKKDYISDDDLLFWITNEYPFYYLEYNSKVLSLYFFTDSLYLKIKEFFEVISYELPFSIKEVNNFWNRSFYINLDVDDWFVRIVVDYKSRVIWLKIKKDEYNKVKWILKKT